MTLWLTHAIDVDALECLFSVERFNHGACRIDWRIDRLWRYPSWISFSDEIQKRHPRSKRQPSIADEFVHVLGSGFILRLGPLLFFRQIIRQCESTITPHFHTPDCPQPSHI
jgi:hypothetical protein